MLYSCFYNVHAREMSQTEEDGREGGAKGRLESVKIHC